MHNKTKVFYMGEEMRRTRDGRYTFKSKIHNFIFNAKTLVRKVVKILTLGGVTGGALYAVFLLGQFTSSVPSFAATQVVDSLPYKIEALKDEVINKIANCESAGYKEDDGLIVFDSNSKASIGELQFQIKTVQHYYKTLYNKTITRKEAILIALDTEKAAQLANDIIFKTDKGLSNWINCTNKLALSAEVKVINKLSK